MASEEVMLRCKMESLRSSSATMAFNNWPGLLGHWIFKFTCVCMTMTSMSAASDLFSARTSSPMLLLLLMSSSWPVLYWERGMNMPLDDGFAAAEEDEEEDELTGWLLFSSNFLILFCASRDSRSCSNSFTKSIAPPTIDAWSPLFHKETNSLKV